MKLGPRAAAAAIITSAALALTACGGGAQGNNPSGPKTAALTLGTVQEIRSWDPAQAHVGHILQPYQAAYDS